MPMAAVGAYFTRHAEVIARMATVAPYREGIRLARLTEGLRSHRKVLC